MTMYITGTDEGIEYGTSYLHTAADLWSLVEPRRGEAIRRWIRERFAAHSDSPDVKVYDVASLRDLLDLLDGLDDALRAEITDDVWRLDEETARRLQAKDETLVDSWQGAQGPVYTLENRVSEVHQVEALARQAIEMNRNLEVY